MRPYKENHYSYHKNFDHVMHSIRPPDHVGGGGGGGGVQKKTAREGAYHVQRKKKEGYNEVLDLFCRFKS